MNVADLAPDSTDYPATVKTRLGTKRLPRIATLGNRDHLDLRLLGFFCSAKCPGNLILDTYDLARALRDAGIPVIGGFHSPMERECLDLLLRGKQPVVVCPARSIQRMRVPPTWKPALEAGRLLVLSPFAERYRSATAELAVRRNQFVAALSETIFVVHAAAGSKTEQLCRELLDDKRRLLAFDREENRNLLDLGATVGKVEQIVGMVATATGRRAGRRQVASESGGPRRQARL